MTNKLFPPFTAYMTTELMISAYTTEKPVPTEYLSAEQNKHNLDIWEKTKVSFPVSDESSKELFDNCCNIFQEKVSPGSANVIYNTSLCLQTNEIIINHLADRLEVFEARTPTRIVHTDGCEGLECLLCDKYGYITINRTAFFIRLKPEAKEMEVKKNIIDANDPKFLLGILKSIKREMPKAKRNRLINLVIVRDYLLSHTSKGGKSSAYEMCEYLGIDPDLYTFNK